MRIGDVAEQAGVNVETLRYYERRGLLPAPVRSPGGHRDYDEDTVRFVRAVKEAQMLGFSLAEIEDFMALTRRAPGRVSQEARSRLTAKLAEIDAKLATLRRMRAGVERALYERWDSLDQSTSTAAYIARGGREPVGEPLHVTNGESAASTLRQTSIEGVVVSWDDALHVGPLAFDPPNRGACAHSSSPTRAGVKRPRSSRSSRVETSCSSGRSVSSSGSSPTSSTSCSSSRFWRRFRSRSTAVELLQTGDYLGAMEGAELEALWPDRALWTTRLSRAAA